MALGLTLFYLTPIPFFIRLHGLLLFAVLALFQPDLAILFVPLTAPLYLIPASLGGLRERETLLPLHEIALIITTGAFAGRWIWQTVMRRTRNSSTAYAESGDVPNAPTPIRRAIVSALPYLLFLLCGIWGVMIALPGSRGEALREFRWLILEPLVFYGLLLLLGRSARRGAAMALIIVGSAVALIGLLQFVGLDLVPLIGQKRSFSENIVDVGNARRVASVYGHPNNLGLFLGRVWPLAAALALVAGIRQATEPRTENREPVRAYIYTRQQNHETTEPPYLGRDALLGRLAILANPRQIGRLQIIPIYAIATLLCLAGLFVSFSRGAWLGAVAACVVLGFRLANQASTVSRQSSGIRYRAIVAVVAVLALLTGLALTMRGGGGSEETRLLLWREAAGYLVQHPFGIGLDQFYAYHLPDSGHSLIDSSLIGTSEQYAAHPHNLLLDIWLRMGPFGLVAFSWLIIRFVRYSTSRDPLMIGALAALAAALTHGLVDQFYFVPDVAFAFWVLLALGERPFAPETGASRHES
jgi:O-antigen ligase